MIIKVTWDGKNKQVIETPDGDFFNTPKKLYGDTEQKALRVWNDYVYYGKTTGCLLTGDQGTGKTLLGQIISNIAIREKNMPVYMVTAKAEGNHDISILIEYMNNLKDCVLFLDEFGKMIKFTAQEQFLTMLSDLKKTKKIFILTENDTSNINRFILNRPGRIKYHFDYTKVNTSVLTDYCKDFHVDPEFEAELLKKHDTTNIFSFDQLEAIVDEHRKYPKERLRDILEVLNVSILRNRITYKLHSVFDKRKEEYVKFNPKSNLALKDIGVYAYNDVSIDILKENKNNDQEQRNEYPSYNSNYLSYHYFIDSQEKVAIKKDDTVVLTTPEYIITYIKEDN